MVGFRKGGGSKVDEIKRGEKYINRACRKLETTNANGRAKWKFPAESVMMKKGRQLKRKRSEAHGTDGEEYTKMK